MAEYDYDDAGNRKPARESGGGRASGGNDFHPMLTANYPVNALDPYSRITSPQQFDVSGSRAVPPTAAATSEKWRPPDLLAGRIRPHSRFRTVDD